ncbi:MAG: hypothetical protein PHW96_02765 [Candidatus Nanoarchaeia archaeon]|nr:hypothetical protein [Candidatus Nanoarchaeia archaeon]
MNIKDIKYDAAGIPHLVIEKDGLSKANVELIGASYIGKKYSGAKMMNSALAYAHETGADVICIPGNGFYFDNRRHSTNKNIRALSNEGIVDHDIIDKYMPDIVKKVNKKDWAGLEKALGADSSDGVDRLMEAIGKVGEIKYDYANSIMKKEATMRLVKDAFKSNEKHEIPIFLSMGPTEFDTYTSEGNDTLRHDSGRNRSRYTVLEGIIKDLRKELSKRLQDAETTKGKSQITKQMGILDEGLISLTAYGKNIIMTNVQDDKRIAYLKNAEDDLIKTLEETIPNSKVLPVDANIRINDAMVNFTHSNYRVSDNPLVSAMERMTKHWRAKVADAKNREDIPRIAVNGNLHGILGVGMINNNAGIRRSQYPLDTHKLDGLKELYTYLVQLPPFMNKKILLSELEQHVLVPQDIAQRMAYTLELFTGALAVDILGKEGEFLGFNVLTQDFLENYSNGEAKAKQPLVFFRSRGDDHIGSQHVKLIEMTPEQRKKAEEEYECNMHGYILPVTLAENVIQSLFDIVSVFFNGDNIQGKNYSLEVERNKGVYKKDMDPDQLRKKIDVIMQNNNISDAEKLIRISNLSIKNAYKTNVVPVQQQINMFEQEMIRDNEKNNKEMLMRAIEKEIIGTKLLYLGCTHTGHTTNTKTHQTGLDINEGFANTARDVYRTIYHSCEEKLGYLKEMYSKLTNTPEDELDIEDLINIDITEGSVGQGTGFAAFSWGVYKRFLYEICAQHKLASTHANQVPEIVNKIKKGQIICDILLGAHTHNPIGAMLGDKLLVVNGATQEDNEWAKKLSLPPSITTSWNVGVPVDGFGSGEIVLVPHSLEFMISALNNPEEVKKLVNSTFKFY